MCLQSLGMHFLHQGNLGGSLWGCLWEPLTTGLCSLSFTAHCPAGPAVLGSGTRIGHTGSLWLWVVFCIWVSWVGGDENTFSVSFSEKNETLPLILSQQYLVSFPSAITVCQL